MKPHVRVTIETLLKRGLSQREIAQHTGADRKTIRHYARALANSPGVATGSVAPEGQTPPPRPPAPAPEAAHPPEPSAHAGAGGSASACEPYRAWIESQVELGRNAVSIYQDLVERHGFSHAYNSVKRFVGRLKAAAPERFDVLEFLPGEEAQVDYGQGAPTLFKPGHYKRPYLFVMTLKFSGKSFRKVVWKTSKKIWAQLHEQAFRAFGACPHYVVLDNLKEGVISPDLYTPALNATYTALLAHYGVAADPCRIRDPNRKGSVENAIKHTQNTALKGRRFESIDAQNAWLAHWEERWAAPRIHGRMKRQVLEMFREELPHLLPLPAEGFRLFEAVTRTVDDSGLVQIESSYYAALPAAPHTEVSVRIYEHDIEILDPSGTLLRRHPKAERKGSFTMSHEDRIFNPSRETARLFERVARIGPHTSTFAHALFDQLGRPGQRALYGLANLPRRYPRADIEAACERLLAAHSVSFAALKRLLAHQHTRSPANPPAVPTGPGVRAIGEYQSFWDAHSHSHPQEEHDDDHVYH